MDLTINRWIWGSPTSFALGMEGIAEMIHDGEMNVRLSDGMAPKVARNPT